MDTTKHRSRFRSATSRAPISLALQGAGSRGAYTWGMLDALLRDRKDSKELGDEIDRRPGESDNLQALKRRPSLVVRHIEAGSLTEAGLIS
jgi:hypothetical protein